MKKILNVAIGVLGLTVAGVLLAAQLQPDTTHVERSATFAAAPADVFPYADDLDGWQKWSPWRDLDPHEKITFSDTRAGVGAWYTWEGEATGAGKMTVVESVPDERVRYDLRFTAPFESRADVVIALAPEGEGTRVTWAFDSENNFMSKLFGLFMDMDAMLGKDFEKGLATLQPLAEADATKRIEAERAAAEAAAQAATQAGTGPHMPDAVLIEH